MAIYTNLDAVTLQKHGVVELSNLKSTIVGNIYDVLVQDEDGDAIDVDNGVLVAVGDYTGNGLQERTATIAAEGDKVALISTPAVVKEAFTKAQAEEYNFYNKAGFLSRAHELVKEDVFGVADYQFTSGTVAVGASVVVDGNGGYKVVSAPSEATYGFIGRIHSIQTGTFDKRVRIEVVQNVQL